MLFIILLVCISFKDLIEDIIEGAGYVDGINYYGGCFIVAQATLHEAMILKDVFTKVV